MIFLEQQNPLTMKGLEAPVGIEYHGCMGKQVFTLRVLNNGSIGIGNGIYHLGINRNVVDDLKLLLAQDYKNSAPLKYLHSASIGESTDKDGITGCFHATTGNTRFSLDLFKNGSAEVSMWNVERPDEKMSISICPDFLDNIKEVFNMNKVELAS